MRNDPRRPIDADDVQEVHGFLIVRYGAAFKAMYEGTNGPNGWPVVVADWVEALAGLKRYHLDYGVKQVTGSFAPKAHEFRALCVNAPVPPAEVDPNAPALPAPDRKRFAETMSVGYRKGVAQREHEGPLAWALRMRDLDEAGRLNSVVKRQMYRDALATKPKTMPIGGFNEIPFDMLPPGMKNDPHLQAKARRQQHGEPPK